MTQRILRLAFLTAMAVLVTASLWSIWQWQYTQAARDAEHYAHSRLALYATTFQGALERFAYLPGLLARQPLVQAALMDEVGVFTPQVNTYLKAVAERSGAEAIFLLNRDGTTVSASNHDSDDSFVGHRYPFRPYFSDAMSGDDGTFFAIGNTTRRPGYFVSTAVMGGSDNRPLGVLAVKISLESLQESWRQAGEKVLLSDANGVVILSSRPEWRYRHLGELSAQALTEIRDQRQFASHALTPLGERLRDGSLRIGDPGLGERFLTLELPLPTQDWTMHYLVPVRPLYTSARNALLAAAGMFLALLLLGLWLRERQKRQRLRDREASIIRDANERLEARVEARTRELESAQNELVQAGKLAALGTMAAGIAHELNQPLSSIRTYAANGERLLARGRTDAADNNFQRIQTLCERQDALIRQLKLFARRGDSPEPVNLAERLDFVLELLDERLEDQGVTLSLKRPGAHAPAPWVMGDTPRLEQLMTNLLHNALDALRGVEAPRLQVELSQSDEHVVLQVADNGCGLEDTNLHKLFDPFYTTKSVGDGLGLGLFICFGIVQDLGGRISASNRPAGGASFRVELPAASAVTGEADA